MILIQRPLLLLALTALIACSVDADGDGFKEDVDCDDTSAAVNPDATEICDGLDNDCDDRVDDADDSLDTATGQTFFADMDADAFGDPATPLLACEAPAGHVGDNTDCNDTTELAHPDAIEICDGLDNDCDELVDDDDDSLDTSTGATFWADADDDGFGDPEAPVQACQVPTGHVADDRDCDDTNDAIKPSAVEICDGLDNDCDALIDDADEGVDLATAMDWFEDSDGDTFGNVDSSLRSCAPPPRDTSPTIRTATMRQPRSTRT